MVFSVIKQVTDTRTRLVWKSGFFCNPASGAYVVGRRLELRAAPTLSAKKVALDNAFSLHFHVLSFPCLRQGSPLKRKTSLRGKSKITFKEKVAYNLLISVLSDCGTGR
jgi:hypothetical protein